MWRNAWGTGTRYRYYNEILGSAQRPLIDPDRSRDFGGGNNLGCAGVYEIFSMPYLFDSEDVYKSVMQDGLYGTGMSPRTGRIRVVTWYNAGTRNFYTKTPIRTPED
ncbi:MAG: hypothetical protein ACLSFC_20890 [Enterocloster bolteae]